MIQESSSLSIVLSAWAMFFFSFASQTIDAQENKTGNKPPAEANDREGASIKGTVEFDKNFMKSWKGTDLVVPFNEIKTKLFQQVELEPVPFPKNWEQMKPEEQQAWAKSFEESEDGKAFIAEREKRIAAARDFDVLIEKDGKFVVYDVPVGIYGLRGRIDKAIDGVMHGFEVFAQLEVIKDMNEVRLPPIQVAVTPMLKSGDVAPPISVSAEDGSAAINLDPFKGSFVLVSFWITNSPSAEYQTRIQEAFGKIKDRHPIQLLSIFVDENPADAVKFIKEKELKLGSHGFTSGFEHRTMFDYGVRAIPTFFLISPEGKIAMSQYEFAMAFRTKNDLAQIITDRIEGKDVPASGQSTTQGVPATKK